MDLFSSDAAAVRAAAASLPRARERADVTPAELRAAIEAVSARWEVVAVVCQAVDVGLLAPEKATATAEFFDTDTERARRALLP